MNKSCSEKWTKLNLNYVNILGVWKGKADRINCHTMMGDQLANTVSD
jgi:hypothetical protein